MTQRLREYKLSWWGRHAVESCLAGACGSCLFTSPQTESRARMEQEAASDLLPETRPIPKGSTSSQTPAAAGD